MSGPREHDWDTLARRARERAGEAEPLTFDLPGHSGRLFVDHAAPALAVHRCHTAPEASGDPSKNRALACSEAHRLVTSQPAYLLASGVSAEASGTAAEGVCALTAATAEALAERAGAALVVEVWTPIDATDDDDVDPFDRRPGFTLYLPDAPEAQAAGAALADALSGIEIAGQGADVTCITTDAIAPPGLAPLLDCAPDARGRSRVALLGLAVDAVFLNTREDEFYPRVLDALRDALAPALEAGATAFADAVGAPEAPSGRRHLEPLAERVDRGLSRLTRQYGFLLQVTPVNSREAWTDFSESGCDSAPELLYRPLTFDSDALRRDLFALPVESVEDPVVARLLREKRDEMATQVQMILDRETPGFLAGSLKIYGAPDDALVALARDVLAAIPEASGARGRVAAGEEVVGATAFAAAADGELEHYRAQFDGFSSSVEIRSDIPGSLMVSQGQLLIGAGASVPAPRVQALLAHEVGTHVLTYYNGCAQPLRLLRHGMAGYESLQEGLAVLAEWLVGGLTPARMQTLAARVLTARCLASGATFIEAFRHLKENTALTDRGAFGITLRVYRGGGLTKDMIYLRGLRDLLAYLGHGGAYWPLFIGKVSLARAADAEALRARGVLHDAPLRPRYAEDADALARLDRARSGLTVLDLMA